MKEFHILRLGVPNGADLETEMNMLGRAGWDIECPINYQGHTTAIVFGRDKQWEPDEMQTRQARQAEDPFTAGTFLCAECRQPVPIGTRCGCLGMRGKR